MTTQPNPTPAISELFRIKPLEWEWFEVLCRRGWRAWTGMHMIESYQTRNINGNWPSTWKWDSVTKLRRPCASPEEGKQLAERHWQEYVKQALVPVEESK